MSKPTPKERVFAALNFEETDIVPYDIVIEAEVEDQLNEHYGGNGWESKIQKHLLPISYPFPMIMDLIDDKYVKDEYGSVWDFSALPFHLVDFPLKEPSLENYDFDSLLETALNSLNMESSRFIISKDSDKFILGQLAGGLFERSWMMRGFENALVDSIAHTAFYEELLDNLTEVHLALIDKLCELPIDAVFLGDDWGDQRGVILGPDRWRRLIKPWAQKLYERVHSNGKMVFTHCCGNVFDIIPDMIEIGLDGLESLQPEAMDVYEIKRRYGKDLRLWGGLGTQQTIPFASPDEIRKEIRRLIAEMGKGGGYIIAPAKPLMRGIPTENAAAVIEEISQNK
jgi:uroporphyrinogen decarboxylase